ncbi:MAG: helix-hairpin-helix domain-containing protein [Acidobacteria bacterium]|nr:helix-hairpin-helix domain-containing protein [Acidobacteriota bacterium]
MKSIYLKWIGCIILAFALFVMASLADDKQAKTQPKTQTLVGKTVNINKATEEDLVKNVPLITRELAKSIVKYRKENGDFQTLEELLQIDGFNRTLLRRIKPFLLLEGIGGKDCTC